MRTPIFAITMIMSLFLATTSTGTTFIFESASLGPTGISNQDLRDGDPGAVGITHGVFSGVKFNLARKTHISRIGGHFVAATLDGGEGSVFGVVVALDNATDFPDSEDLSSEDVLGHTLIPLPLLSAETSGELSLVVDPGWYALVFGSELFGADGFGGAVSNGSDINDPTYIGGQSNTIGFWRELPVMFSNQRFFAEGAFIPEPSSLALISFAAFGLLVRRR